MTFRYDINALRGIAVLIVMLFHFGIPGFSGGYSGVDIFFVISGFLMTSIIVLGLEDQKFSLLKFYASRARRILPAIIFLCGTVLIFGWFWIAPSDYSDLGEHAAASVIFISNFIYKDEAGYFDTPSHFKWLLHTWSLSVEWQFYMIYPLILMGAYRFSRYKSRAIMITLGVLTLLSLGLSIFISELKPEFSFFILPTRIWEMTAGGLLFLLQRRDGFSITSNHQKYLFTIGGLCLILVAAIIYHSDYSWPGGYALLPVIGAILFLVPRANNQALVNNIILQKLGTWSYSTYLWHWPIYVGISYYELHIIGWQAGAIILSIFCGFLSYKLIENPCHKMTICRKNMIILFAAICAVGLSGLLIKSQNGFPLRVSKEILIADKEAENKPPYTEKDLCAPDHDSAGRMRCVYGNRDNIGAIFWGDSHGGAIMTALGDAIGQGVITHFNQCPVIFSARIKGKTQRKNCKGFHQNVLTDIETLPDDVPLVIVSRFSAQIHGPNETNQKVYGLIFDDKTSNEETLTERALYQKRLVETLCHAKRFRPVYVIEPVPEMGADIPKMIVRQLMQGIKPHAGITKSAYDARNTIILDILNQAQQTCDINLLPTSDYLCPDGNTCIGALSGRPIYVDDDHLSEFGNRLLIPMFEKALK